MLGTQRVIAGGRNPQALDRMRGMEAMTVSLAHDTPEAVASLFVAPDSCG